MHEELSLVYETGRVLGAQQSSPLLPLLGLDPGLFLGGQVLIARAYRLAHLEPQSLRFKLALLLHGHNEPLQPLLDHLFGRVPELHSLASRLLMQHDLAVPLAREHAERFFIRKLDLSVDVIRRFITAQQRFQLELDLARVARLGALDFDLSAELHGHFTDEYALTVRVWQRDNVLFASIEQNYLDPALHDGADRVAVELGSGQNCAVDAVALLAVAHVERGYWRVMRDLFGDVEGAAPGGRIQPVCTKHLAQDRIVGLLEAFGLLVEAGQVELDDELHTLVGIVAAGALAQYVRVVVVVGEFFQKRTRLENERGQDHLGQVHSWTHLFGQAKNEALVLVSDFFSLILNKNQV
jgi:hypothetical protein